MSYVMPAEDSSWGCVRSLEIMCSSCILALFAAVYSFVKHCYRHVIPALGSLLFVLIVYVVVSNRMFFMNPLKYDVYEMTAVVFIIVSFIIRSRFRYVIYPFIYTEHCRLFSDVYLRWWSSRIFTRIHLGGDEFESSCMETGLAEVLTDYVLCFVVNTFVVIGFMISSLIGVFYCLVYTLFIHILWPLLLFIGFAIYPVIFIPDLLCGVVHHICSSSGKFHLLYLKGIFLSLDFYWRYTFDIQYDISTWLDDREHYGKLWKMILLLCFYVTIGPRAFSYVNDAASLGYYTDKDDNQNYYVVSFSLLEYNSLAIECVTTFLGYIFILTSSKNVLLLSLGVPLLICTAFCELYLFVVWPRWTPTSTKSAIYPASDDDVFASDNSTKSEKFKTGFVSLVDLAY